MALWGKLNQANNAPKENNIIAGVNATGSALYGNNTPGAFVQDVAVGVFAANTADVQAKAQIKAQGWHTVKYGTGPIASVSVANAGSGFANTDIVKFTGGTANGTATIGTDANGAITSVSLTGAGRGFSNVASVTATFYKADGTTSSNGAGGVLALKLGGRAGRIQTECLARVKITGNTAIPVS